jgi:hypothetical protein
MAAVVIRIIIVALAYKACSDWVDKFMSRDRVREKLIDEPGSYEFRG